MNNIYSAACICYNGVIIFMAVLVASLENVVEHYAPTPFLIGPLPGGSLNVLDKTLLGSYRLSLLLGKASLKLIILLLKAYRKFLILLGKALIKYIKKKREQKKNRPKHGVDYEGRRLIR